MRIVLRAVVCASALSFFSVSGYLACGASGVAPATPRRDASGGTASDGAGDSVVKNDRGPDGTMVGDGPPDADASADASMQLEELEGTQPEFVVDE